ncbi:cytochrome P460 family protein [Pseudomonas sp. NPDC078700]|uniref:cytochrome P460 family protein n=1 Tax=Pseudomonas sp. NPDC078700 TaxID=3364424 RepID=UPI0037CAA104
MFRNAKLFGSTSKDPLKKVASDGSTRQKDAKKRSLVVLNEHFEQIFNAVIPSAVVFQRFPKWVLLALSLTALGSVAQAAETVKESAKAHFVDAATAHIPQGYRSWTHIGTFVTPPGSHTILGGGTREGAQFGNTYVETSALEIYKATHKWPDGTQFVKEFSESSLSDTCDKTTGVCEQNKGKKWPQKMVSCDKTTGVCVTTHGKGIFQNNFFGVTYMVKDAARFPKAPGNWGYFSFGPAKDAKSYPQTSKLQPYEKCAGCHVAKVADKDYVFSDLHLGLQ